MARNVWQLVHIFIILLMLNYPVPVKCDFKNDFEDAAHYFYYDDDGGNDNDDDDISRYAHTNEFTIDGDIVNIDYDTIEKPLSDFEEDDSDDTVKNENIALEIGHDYDNDENIGNKTKRQSNVNEPAFVQALDKFSMKLFRILVNEYPGKVIAFSPLSIHMTFSMILHGADNEMITSMSNALGLSDPLTDVEELGILYSSIIKKFNSLPNIHISNKFYVNLDQRGRKSFFGAMAKNFNAEIVTFDFGGGFSSKDVINDWVESKSNGLIKNFLPYNALYSTSSMLLLNIVYFKAKWNYTLVEPNSKTCNTKDGAPYPYTTHKLKATILGEKLQDKTTLALHHTDSKMMRLVVLPKSEDFTAIQRSLYSETLNGMLERLSFIESGMLFTEKERSAEVELNTPLQVLGMDELFSETENLVVVLRDQKILRIGRVWHKVFLRTSKEGNEAAAVTGVLFHPKCTRFQAVPMDSFCDVPSFFAYVDGEDVNTFIPFLMGKDI